MKEINMQDQSDDLLEIRYLNKNNTKFTRTPGGFIDLEYRHEKYKRVGIYRAFPFTDKDHYISVREANEKAREIGIIKDLEKDMNPEEIKMINEQLNMRYYTPHIKKINDIKDEYGYAYFDVVTDFGKSKFTIQMNSGAIINLSETRILITDLDGNRYEIADIHKLTANELKKLDLFI